MKVKVKVTITENAMIDVVSGTRRVRPNMQETRLGGRN